MEQVIHKIRDVRTKSIEERSRLLFTEIDQLGHYTQSSWFTNLERREYLRYFRCIHDIWVFRAQLSSDIKHKICPLWDPFIFLTTNTSINLVEMTKEQLANLCLSVMEDIVYTGIDHEFKVLGAFHVLVALTIVSLPARGNMPWLYESVAY